MVKNLNRKAKKRSWSLKFELWVNKQRNPLKYRRWNLSKGLSIILLPNSLWDFYGGKRRGVRIIPPPPLQSLLCYCFVKALGLVLRHLNNGEVGGNRNHKVCTICLLQRFCIYIFFFAFNMKHVTKSPEYWSNLLGRVFCLRKSSLLILLPNTWILPPPRFKFSDRTSLKLFQTTKACQSRLNESWKS